MDIGISSFVRDVPLKIRGIPAWPFPPDNGQHPFGGIGQLPTSFCWKHEAQDAQGRIHVEQAAPLGLEGCRVPAGELQAQTLTFIA